MGADLYTSLIRAKQELNDGVLPPMTPVPENVQHFIDPNFTPGLGALEEDEEKGLRCPVRGCGRWYHVLSRHLNLTHSDIGGCSKIKSALDIPRGAKLVSRISSRRIAVHADEARRRITQLWASGRLNAPKPRASQARRANKSKRTVGMRNLKNTCENQLAHRFLAVRDKVGRQPSLAEMRHHDSQAASAATKIYGGWAAFLATMNLKVRPPGGSLLPEQAIIIVKEWYDKHGSLPTSGDVNNGNRTPMIPYGATLTAFGTKSWPVAMRKVAVRMGIFDRRFRPEPGARAIRGGVGYTKKELVASFHGYYDANGRLPSSTAARSHNGLPSIVTVHKHLKTQCWQEAMREVAISLDIYDANYRPKPGTESFPSPISYTRNGVLDYLGLFYEKHSHLPTINESDSPSRRRGLPGSHTILNHLGETSWVSAMHKVAVSLDVYDARYRPQQGG